MEQSTASDTLDRIRDGGTYMLSVCRQRLADAETALEEGRFEDALERAKEAVGRIACIANVQANLGDFADARIIRASDVEEGMRLYSWGLVSGVAPADQPSGQQEIIKLQTEDGEKLIHATGELVVRPS